MNLVVFFASRLFVIPRSRSGALVQVYQNSVNQCFATPELLAAGPLQTPRRAEALFVFPPTRQRLDDPSGRHQNS